MKEVDEERILDEAEKLYALRQQMESIADKLCEKGFDNILFTSAGGVGTFFSYDAEDVIDTMLYSASGRSHCHWKSHGDGKNNSYPYIQIW